MKDKHKKIIKLTKEQYLSLPENMKSALSEYYIRQMTAKDDIFGCLLEDNTIVAYVIVIRTVFHQEIRYIFTQDKFRRQGIAGFLIRGIQKSDIRTLTANVVAESEEGQSLANIFKGIGFKVTKSKTVYTVNTHEKLWARKEELKFDQMQKLILNGTDDSIVECVSFKDMNDDVLGQLRKSRRTKFWNDLLPGPYINNRNSKLDWDLSFAMTVNGKLMAYTLIVRPKEDTVIVEQISTSKETKGNGSVICPLCSTINAIRDDGRIKKAIMTIEDNNLESIKLTEHIINTLKPHKKKIQTYKRRFI